MSQATEEAKRNNIMDIMNLCYPSDPQTTQPTHHLRRRTGTTSQCIALEFGVVSLGLHCFLRLSHALCCSRRCLAGVAFSVLHILRECYLFDPTKSASRSASCVCEDSCECTTFTWLLSISVSLPLPATIGAALSGTNRCINTSEFTRYPPFTCCRIMKALPAGVSVV